MHYHNIKSKMWSSRNGTYRKILRTYGDGTAIVASYLMTSPHAKQSGLYSCPISYIASETERSIEDVEECLQNLDEINYCKYDFDEEVVWVFKMVEYQVSPHWTQLKRDVDSKKRQDSRYQGVINSLTNVAYSYLHEQFCKFWSLPPELREVPQEHSVSTDSTVGDPTRPLQAPYTPPQEKGTAKGFQRASKGSDS